MPDKDTIPNKAGITKNLLKDTEKQEDRMAQKILEKKPKSDSYSSDTFKKIEKQVKDSLKKQDTDEALKSVSV